MGRYRARDLVNLPGLLSLARVPLAAAFVLLVDRPAAAIAVLFAAGLSDLLDGWYARRNGLVTATGSALDPITDKLFVLTVAVTLVATGRLSPLDVLLLSTRELGELPLVLWVAFSQQARRARAGTAMANVPGKIATAFQFVAVGTVLVRPGAAPFWIGAAAAAGVVAAASYWARELRARPRLHA